MIRFINERGNHGCVNVANTVSCVANTAELNLMIESISEREEHSCAQSDDEVY